MKKKKPAKVTARMVNKRLEYAQHEAQRRLARDVGEWIIETEDAVLAWSNRVMADMASIQASFVAAHTAVGVHSGDLSLALQQSMAKWTQLKKRSRYL